MLFTHFIKNQQALLDFLPLNPLNSFKRGRRSMPEAQIILTTVIALIAVMTGLGFIFNILLTPVKENQNDLKNSQDDLKNSQDDLKNNQNDFNKRLSVIEKKIDQILNR